MSALTRIALATTSLAFLWGAAWAEDAPIQLVIKDHRFVPAEIHVKAGSPALLLVQNQDSTAEEVESKQLGVEKVVPPGAQSKIRLRPLAPGRYPFMGEYHADTAQGVVIAE